MDGPEPRPALASFLAEHDAPCPLCGYNLRGVESDRCPECGERLELGLVKRKRLRGWGPFLVLALGWLLLAGSMNTVRGVQGLIQEQRRVEAENRRAAAVQQQLQKSLAALDQSLGNTPSFGGMGGPFDEDFKRFQERADANMRDMQKRMIQSQLNALAVRMPTKAIPTLPQVWLGGTALEKSQSLGWLSLTALGFIGLTWTALLALRGSVRGLSVLVWTAATLFVLYAAWHVIVLVREVW
jgi:hypothetical protein